MTKSDASYDDRRAAAYEPARLRIGDAERHQATDALSRHVAAGRLSLDEYEQRLDQVLRAKTEEDLRPLFVDLPSEPFAVSRAATPKPSGSTHHEPEIRRPVLAWALAGPWLSVNLMMVFIWAATGAGYFWPIWVMGPWGLAILPGVLGSSRRSRRGRRRRRRA